LPSIGCFFALPALALLARRKPTVDFLFGYRGRETPDALDLTGFGRFDGVLRQPFPYPIVEE
jgi:hypothetical protein